MTTLAQLKRKVKQSNFHREILDKGFSLGPQGFFYYRWRGEFLDLIQFWIKTNGTRVEVHVCTVVSEMIERKGYNMVNFPVGYSKIASNPTAQRLTKDGIKLLGKRWCIGTDDEINDMLSELSKSIELYLIPWFEGINSRKDIYNSIWANSREGPAANWLRETLLDK